MRREILTFPASGSSLVGTAHLPSGPTGETAGFLFLNAGPAPRSGNSDLSAHVCDHLASIGFPSFRFDLPGLGDSPGDLPGDVEVFWHDIQQGRNVAPTVEIVRQLRAKYSLTDVIVGGMCAGAITSLLALAQAEEEISGLILLEPNFRISAGERQPAPRSAAPTSMGNSVAGLGREWISVQVLRHLTRRSLLAGIITPLTPVLVRLLTLVAGRPREINWPAVSAWRRALSRRVPVFLATARGAGEDHYCQCLMLDFPRGLGRSLTNLNVPDTNHIMTRGEARNLLVKSISSWARARYGRGGGTARHGNGAESSPHTAESGRSEASTRGWGPRLPATSGPAQAGPA